MAEFVVHTVPGSPFGRSVLATLEEKGVAWQLAPVQPTERKQPAHLARHPFGRVPVLEHDGFRLYETQAILRYLDRVLPSPRLTPADPRAAAIMDLAMAVNDWYLFQGVANVIVFHRIISPRVLGGVPDEAAIAAALPQARTVIDELGRLLGSKDYFAGDTASLADLHLGPGVALMALTPEWAELSASQPGLVAWVARMEARPSFTATTWERQVARAAA